MCCQGNLSRYRVLTQAKSENSLGQKQNSEILCESDGVKNEMKKDTYHVCEFSHQFIKITIRPI